MVVIMFKAQMKFQKVVAFVTLIAAVVSFVYALGFITTLHGTLFYTLPDPDDHTLSKVEGTQFYYELQSNVTYEEIKTEVDGKVVTQTVKHKDIGYNDKLVMVGIGLIIVSLVLFLTNTHVRRKYYIGNYIATGLVAVANIGAAAWLMRESAYFMGKFMEIDFEALKEFCEFWKYPYNDSTLCFTLGYALSGLLVLVAALAVANLIWKISLMKRENKLLGKGVRKEVAVNE